LAASSAPRQSDQDPAWHDRLDQQTIAPSLAPTSQTATKRPPAKGSAQGVQGAVDPGQVRLRDLRIIQLHTGRDGAPRQLDTADPTTVLRILEADLAWLKGIDHHTP